MQSPSPSMEGLVQGPMSLAGPLPALFGAVSRPILITLLSYLLGAFRIVKLTSTEGLNDIVNRLLLPSLLLKAMLTIDLSDVQWTILIIIFIAKFLLMLFTWALVQVFISNKRLSKMGIYGIFVTLSNDVAVGLPIMQALFPKYQNYLLLVKPQQMLLLNGLGLALLEMAQLTEGATADTTKSLPSVHHGQVSLGKVLLRVFPELTVRLAKNPSLNTVFFGLFVNAMFGPKFLPDFILGALEVTGAGYTGCALASLGLSMVGKEKVLLGRGLTWPFVLATLKCVALPFLTHAVAQMFTDDRDLLGFSFVYGAIPAGPHAFTFAAQYGASTDTIAGSLVISLFMSTLVTMAGTIRMQAPADMMSEDIAEISAWIALLAVVMVFPMVLAFAAQSLPWGSPVRWLRWLMLSELCFSIMHLVCVWTPAHSCLFLVRILHDYFRIQTSVWMCCLGVTLLHYSSNYRCDVGSWARLYHIVAWGMPGVLLLPILHTLRKPFHGLRCILRPGMKQSIASVLTFSCFIMCNVYCLIVAQRRHRALLRRKIENEIADCSTPLRRSSTTGYRSMLYRAESASRCSSDSTAAFFFRVKLVLVCETINLMFQTLGEAGALLGQRTFFYLPFLFGMLLEQGQPILLFLVFGLENHFVEHCYSCLAALGLRRSSAADDEDYCGPTTSPTSPAEVWPELPYDDLLDIYSDLIPLLHTVQGYRQCFLGNMAVDTMLKANRATSRAHAVAIGRQMLAYHLISHVRLERNFEDGPKAYRLAEPFDSECTTWDSEWHDVEKEEL